MGYYVQLQDANFVIPKENLEEALRLLKALNHKPTADKGGGSYGPGGKTQAWFAWMDADYDQHVTSAKEVFEQLGFGVTDTPEGGISLEYFDRKIGDEDQFIQEVQHLANEDWYLVWRGEDGASWRMDASGTKQGRLVFE